MTSSQPEVWLRGPIENIPALLHPVAHALLQARNEINESINNFPADKLWERPAGVASIAFHLQHLTGVLDRLFTYARGESLTEHQLQYLNEEGKKKDDVSLKNLLIAFNKQVDVALQQISQTKEQTLTNYRAVGRRALPSTVIGLLFHAAEHTMRHTGQLMVTAKVLSNSK